MTTCATPTSKARYLSSRATYGALCAALVLALVLELARHGAGYWQLPVFAIAPDIALFVGAGRGLARGQLHPRAVGLYNALHRAWGPLALATLAVTSLIPGGYLIGALTWAFHISLDRALGYGLRSRDGFQRS
jgi:DNA-binding transcriptional LysR family regulator